MIKARKFFKEKYFPFFRAANLPAGRQAEPGFTLIEIMVVIVILGILAGLIVPKIMGRPEEARRIKA
ncbi:MAG: prepilin-type N-terminal cleavage/methylation domain-containing protein, partial [Deltaproteobacteria bacterium]|nr:prepilin-type N-terminal cleavage/methylation domain-containing protein [Deltaproteobacteria bacterium]